MNIHYRPDIDGLRAIAVVVVIFFHFNIPGFSAGYIGVDVFFVISGFLITSILMREISAGVFSIGNFYERRIRRIFPMLFFISIFFLVLGYIVMDSLTYKSLGGSVGAGSLFFSNIYFQRTISGYFGSGNFSLIPFLHTWSLSVEEQFYIVFPVFLFMLHKSRKGSFLLPLIWAGILSLVLYIAVSIYYPSYVFFLAPARAWEFLAGACVAVAITRKNKIGVPIAISYLAGIVCVLLGLVVFWRLVLPVGMYILFSVLGAMLIIYTGTHQKGILYRWLSFKPLVFTGKISYSLYLWHFPVYAFAGYLLDRQPVALEKGLLLFLVLVLSILSYYFIETPFRIIQSAGSRKWHVFSMAILFIVVIGGAGFWIYWKDGLPNRYAENASLHEAFSNKEFKYWRSVTSNTVAILSDKKNPPVIGENSLPASFLLWGDSHAIALAPGLDSVARLKKRKGYVTVRNGTGPIPGLTGPRDPEYHRFNDLVLSFITHHPEIKIIVLAARWRRYVSLSNQQTELRSIIEKLLSLNKRVVVVNEIPETSKDMRWLTAYKIRNRFFTSPAMDISMSLNAYQESNKKVDSLFEAFQKDYAITILHCEKRLVEAGKFIFEKDNHFIYSDVHHLSAFGAKYVSGMFDEIFQ